MLDPALRRALWLFFLVHAALFAGANLFFLLLNLALRGTIWFFYPLVFWLLFLLLHFYLNKLIISGFFHRRWDALLDWLDR
ncbi:MAG: 2TM domain-containing protein [Candidatus Margulisbacteria bacterium]|jgi:hypothetical protein|nr:2TM domain-containing protein [Candidatus Margulisiibacteriota bacterium]